MDLPHILQTTHHLEQSESLLRRLHVLTALTFPASRSVSLFFHLPSQAVLTRPFLSSPERVLLEPPIQGVVCGSGTSASPGSSSGLRRPRARPRPPGSESAFNPQVGRLHRFRQRLPNWLDDQNDPGQFLYLQTRGLGGFLSRRLVLSVLEDGSPGSSHRPSDLLERTLFLACSRPPSRCALISVAERGRSGVPP